MVEAEDGPGELVRSLAADWCCWFRLVELEWVFTLQRKGWRKVKD